MGAEEIRAASRAARAARDDVMTSMSGLRAELDAMMREPLVTDEEKRQLQQVAQSGEMGRDMRDFSEEVRRGNADWESFLRGQDEHRGLLENLVERTGEEHMERLAAAFAASEAPPDVEDPRPDRQE